MRLDHLLSKETSSAHKVLVTFLGQTFSKVLTLFNLEGTRESEYLLLHLEN